MINFQNTRTRKVKAMNNELKKVSKKELIQYAKEVADKLENAKNTNSIAVFQFVIENIPCNLAISTMHTIQFSTCGIIPYGFITGYKEDAINKCIEYVNLGREEESIKKFSVSLLTNLRDGLKENK